MPADVPDDVATETAHQWERPRDVQACMAEQGWEMVLDEIDGSLEAQDVPDEQVVQFQTDFEDCLQRFPQPELVISEENAAAYYDALIVAGECLVDLGYSVPEPPSRQASIESMLDGSGIIDPLWDPYEPLFVGDIDHVDFARAMVACPQPEWGSAR